MAENQRFTEINSFSKSFSTLKDPRRIKRGNFLYPLDEILFLTISAVVSGCHSWDEIEYFGEQKTDWLRKFFPFKNGIPSHDVINRVFNSLDNTVFNHCFIDWVNSISILTAGRIIPIDGKTIRGASECGGFSKLHVVNAFCTTNNICLGQQAVEEKSNEITAIPDLLDLLAIKGCIITIDAMGCQTEIAEKIMSKGADYILAVKGNQKELKEQVSKLFRLNKPDDINEQTDIGHGRIENRLCEVISELKFLDDKEKWVGIQTVVRITSQRTIKKTGKSKNEVRYYISSLNTDAAMLNNAIRTHWAIENKLHWSLDVIMREDYQLKRKNYAALNFNIVRKIALGILEQKTEKKATKKMKMMKALLNDDFREKLMKI